MPHKKLVIVLWFILLILPFPCWGMFASNATNLTLLHKEDQSSLLLLGMSVQMEHGDMAYTIQGRESGGWKSTLKWPLKNILYIGGIGSLRFFDRLQMNAGVWKSVTDDAGIMKDSDWFYGYYGSQKVVYSETDTTVNALQFDVNLRYNLFQTDSLAFGTILGYALTKWDWEAGNGYQWTIDPDEFYVGPLTGTAITYLQEIKVPYIGAAVSLSVANAMVGVHLYTLYSPIAKCDDEDDHILRYKLSQGKTDGTFFSLGTELRWNANSRWSVTGHLAYSSYDLHGDQIQYFYAGENAGYGAADIDLNVEGSQTYIGLTIGYEL